GGFLSTNVQGAFAELARVAAADDGAKRVGTEPKPGMPSTTVRGQLDDLNGKKLALAGGTMSGGLVLGPGAFLEQLEADVPDQNSTIDISARFWNCASPTGPRLHTVRSSAPPVPADGVSMTVTRPATGAYAIGLQREDGTLICLLCPSTWASAELLYKTNKG